MAANQRGVICFWSFVLAAEHYRPLWRYAEMTDRELVQVLGKGVAIDEISGLAIDIDEGWFHGGQVEWRAAACWMCFNPSVGDHNRSVVWHHRDVMWAGAM